MSEQVLNDVVARKFLLGQLSPEEQGQIEELAFDDCDSFAFIESVEEDLIDEFIQGDLSPDERRRFENHFLTLPGRRENLKISRILQQHFTEPEPVDAVSDVGKVTPAGWFQLPRPSLRFLAAAAFVVLLVLVVWLFLNKSKETNPGPIQAGPDKPIVAPAPDSQPSPIPDPTQSPVHADNKPKQPSSEKPRREAAYAIVMPAGVRSEDVVDTFALPGSTNMSLELPLLTRGRYKTFEATLETEGGQGLHRWPNLKAEQLRAGRGLWVDVPVALLKPQQTYVIVVSGSLADGKVQEVARHPFEVTN